MKCPFCGYTKTSVIVTGKDDGGKLQRRRECPECGKRFTTYERPYIGTPMVVKSDGKREEFSREKLLRGFRIACAKRPVPQEKLIALAESIEHALQMRGKTEVNSRVIGDMAIAGLKKLDYIAYIRFAIVYLNFRDLNDLQREIDKLLAEQK